MRFELAGPKCQSNFDPPKPTTRRVFGYGASTEVWEDSVDELKLSGSVFCLTGDFVSRDRESVDTLLRLLGAQTNSSINKSVNYLVIGTLASRDWLYTSQGRKIEKALLLKREGSDIKIITQRTLLKYAH